MTRREFIVAGGAFATAAAAGAEEAKTPVLRFGMVTDSHYANIDDKIGRSYRQSLAKIDACVSDFNARQCDFAIELGDFKDLSADKDATLKTLDAIEAHFAKFKGDIYHVCGNHDFDCLTPEEFLAHVHNAGEADAQERVPPGESAKEADAQERVPPGVDAKAAVSKALGYYSFTRKGIKFIVLDGCYTSNGKHYSRSNPWTDANIPPAQLEWLERELASCTGAAVVFCHQLLDPQGDRNHQLRNQAAVRAVVEKSGKVKTVLTGHYHPGRRRVVNGILHFTLAAQVTGKTNPHAIVSVFADGSVEIENF